MLRVKTEREEREEKSEEWKRERRGAGIGCEMVGRGREENGGGESWGREGQNWTDLAYDLESDILNIAEYSARMKLRKSV